MKKPNKKNFTKRGKITNLDVKKRKGITTLGVENYFFLKSKGFSSGKSFRMLLEWDRAGKNASNLKKGYKDKKIMPEIEKKDRESKNNEKT